MSSNEPISTYDSNGKLIHYKTSTGFEQWWERDSNGKVIHYKDSNRHEWWREYDSNGNEIHYKDSRGLESWYDSKGYKVYFKYSDGAEHWYWEDKETKDPVKILILASQINSNV